MTVDQLHDLFDLDAKTGELRWKVRPSRNVFQGQVAGYAPAGGYTLVGVGGCMLRAHRIVFAMTHGFFPEVVDHINGDKQDNRPCNLRAADRNQNRQNSCRPRNNRSGIKGISWNQERRKWVATVGASGKSHYLGHFADLESACACVRAYREQLHKGFTRHE